MDAPDLYAPTTKKARIEIIPLIDVIFFLLATFVLFTLSLEKIKAIEVPLPIGDKSEENVLFLEACEGGTYRWQEGQTGFVETITVAELAPRLTEYKQRSANPRVMIRGDLRAKFGAAVLALDAVRASHIKQVSVQTTR